MLDFGSLELFCLITGNEVMVFSTLAEEEVSY